MSSLSHRGHPTLSGLQWLACYFNPPPTKKKKTTHTYIHTQKRDYVNAVCNLCQIQECVHFASAILRLPAR